MKERPILFSAPMVQAILAGNKTQTRRIVKLPENGFHNFQFSHMYLNNAAFVSNGEGVTRAEHIPCPYGHSGDQLWVRETFSTISKRPGSSDKGYAYKADLKAGEWYPMVEKWTRSIHMPRKASRIQLEITNIRVERLQDISEADAIAEGCDNSKSQAAKSIGWYEKPRKAFLRLWESINGHDVPIHDADGKKTGMQPNPARWEANPWVWVIEFKRVEA